MTTLNKLRWIFPNKFNPFIRKSSTLFSIFTLKKRKIGSNAPIFTTRYDWACTPCNTVHWCVQFFLGIEAYKTTQSTKKVPPVFQRVRLFSFYETTQGVIPSPSNIVSTHSASGRFALFISSGTTVWMSRFSYRTSYAACAMGNSMPTFCASVRALAAA